MLQSCKYNILHSHQDSSFGAFPIACSGESLYNDRMKISNSYQRRLRAEEVNHLCEDDKSMTIFYTLLLEEVENLVTSLHKKMDPNDPCIGQKITTLEDVIDTLERLHQRCEFSAKFLQTPVLPGEPA